MDQHKEEEDKFPESSAQPRKEEAEEVDTSEESTGQQPVECKEGRSSEEEEEEEEEELTVQLKLVESGAEEEASSPPFTHPCSLLRYLLRFCAGCWGLHGAFGDDPKPQPAAAVAPPEADVAPANSSEKGGAGGEKANYFYMQGEVVTRLWAVRRGRPPGGPGHPREGSGGYGGHHN